MMLGEPACHSSLRGVCGHRHAQRNAGQLRATVGDSKVLRLKAPQRAAFKRCLLQKYVEGGKLPTDGHDAVYHRALGYRKDDHVVFVVLVDLVIRLLAHA